MNADSIKSAMADLSVLEQKGCSDVAMIRRKKDALHIDLIRSGGAERDVTDHAVLRYLERFKGVDISSIRAEIRALADGSEAAKDGEHHWHPTNVILVLGDRGQVITVLSPEQAAKHEGRRLRSGRHIPRTETAQQHEPSTDTKQNETGTIAGTESD